MSPVETSWQGCSEREELGLRAESSGHGNIDLDAGKSLASVPSDAHPKAPSTRLDRELDALTLPPLSRRECWHEQTQECMFVCPVLRLQMDPIQMTVPTPFFIRGCQGACQVWGQHISFLLTMDLRALI